MRTRRSPRNQDILFRALFKPEDVQRQPPKLSALERIRRDLQDPFLNKRAKSMLMKELAKEEARAHAMSVLEGER